MQTDLTRRQVIQATGAASLAWALPSLGQDAAPAPAAPRLADCQPLSIGLVADVHMDTIHDGYARMRYFIDDMLEREPDALLQLGDFAVPRPRNQPFLDTWNEFEGPRYHVLGNHDMDHGFTKEQTMAWWGMDSRFYSFDQHGWHFAVLDGNKKDAPWVGEVDEEQQAWLAEDLAQTESPTIVLSHQSLESTRGGVTNGEAVQAILENANAQAVADSGFRKVIACLSGHHHADYVREINDIPYIQINSMAYKYLGGGALSRERYPKHIEHTYPSVNLVSPYRDPLYTVLHLDPEAGTLSIEGMETEFVSPTPEEMEVPNANRLSTAITARELSIV